MEKIPVSRAVYFYNENHPSLNDSFFSESVENDSEEADSDE